MSRCFRYIVAILLIASGAVSMLNAATITTTGTGGNWNSTATWSPAQVPTSADSVVIATGDTVTVNVSNAACKSMLISDAAGTGYLKFNSGSQLAVSSIFKPGSSASNHGSVDMTNGGTLIVKSITVSANFGTLTAGSGTIQFNGSSVSVPSVTGWNTYNNLVSNSNSLSLGGSVTINGNLTVNDGCLLNIGSNTANRSSAGGAITLGFFAELQIGGTGGFPSNYSTANLDQLSIVTYQGSNQSVAGKAYGQLNLYNSGTKTLAADASAAGTILIDNSATFSDGGHTLTIGADFQAISGTFSASGTLVADGALSTTQTLSGFSSVHNLTVNGPSDLTLSVPSTFSCAALTMTSGDIITAGTLSAASLSGGNTNSYVSGGLSAPALAATATKFPVGKNGYAPVTFTPVSNTSFTLSETAGAPIVVVDDANVLYRTYHITSAGVVTTVVFEYPDADVHGDEASYEAGIFNGAQWDVVASTANAAANTNTLTSYTMPSAQYDWTLGRRLALPIEMSVFTGSVNAAHGVALEWTTVTETNNLGFTVQRKAEGGSAYADISSLIPGAGTSLESHNYAWTDASVTAGTWYYRLKLSDATGGFSYSNEIRIVAGALGVADRAPLVFSLGANYPNPFNPSTVIPFSLPDRASVTLEIFDAAGRSVAVPLDAQSFDAGEHTVRFDASSLSSGAYWYRLTARGAEARVATGRMMLVK